MRHIFDGSVTFPEHVIILGTGPNGRTAYDRLRERPVIAVNKSILILRDMGIHPAWWIMSSDYYLDSQTEYLCRGAEYCQEVAAPFAFSHHLASRVEKELQVPVPYWYQQIPRFERYHIKSDPILSGATVSGTALQIARLLGSKSIALIGVDMFGATQWNGVEEENYPCGNHDHSAWSELDCLQSLMDSDIEIWSDSQLKVKPAVRVTGQTGNQEDQ